MKPLTIKQLKYVSTLVRFGNKRQAVISAGYKVKNRRQADSFVYWLNKSPRVRAEIDRLLNQAGLTEEFLARRLADAIKQGWGVRATHADTLNALELAFKVIYQF